MTINRYFNPSASLVILDFGDLVESDWMWTLAGVFAFIGASVSIYNICRHLSHWTKPIYQLWIVRVLFIIPVYSLISFMSMRFKKEALYIEILRDCYEAFVIYCFMVWILNVVGGEESCGVSIARKMYMKHPPPLCCLPVMRLNSGFLRGCKQLTLQFVILKPITGTVSFILLLIGGEALYFNNWWQLILLTFYNVSYTLALYGLLLFYLATKTEMDSYSPVKKFFAVKAIIFMTYWQSLFVPFVFGVEYADNYNDFLLCIEMTFFAYMHYRAFPWWEFRWSKIPIHDANTYDVNMHIKSVHELSPKSSPHNQPEFGMDANFSDFSAFSPPANNNRSNSSFIKMEVANATTATTKSNDDANIIIQEIDAHSSNIHMNVKIGGKYKNINHINNTHNENNTDLSINNANANANAGDIIGNTSTNANTNTSARGYSNNKLRFTSIDDICYENNSNSNAYEYEYQNEPEINIDLNMNGMKDSQNGDSSGTNVSSDDNDTDTARNQHNHNGQPMRAGSPLRRRRSSDSIAIIHHSNPFSCREWLLALWTVINLSDVCNDAYYNLVPLSVVEERIRTEEQNNQNAMKRRESKYQSPTTTQAQPQSHNNNRLTNNNNKKKDNKMSLLLDVDDQLLNNSPERRRQIYLEESQKTGIELIAQTVVYDKGMKKQSEKNVSGNEEGI